MYTKGKTILDCLFTKGDRGGVGVWGGAGWGGGSYGQVEGGGRGRSLLFLLSEEPLCAGDIITQHH